MSARQSPSSQISRSTTKFGLMLSLLVLGILALKTTASSSGHYQHLAFWKRDSQLSHSHHSYALKKRETSKEKQKTQSMGAVGGDSTTGGGVGGGGNSNPGGGGGGGGGSSSNPGGGGGGGSSNPGGGGGNGKKKGQDSGGGGGDGHGHGSGDDHGGGSNGGGSNGGGNHGGNNGGNKGGAQTGNQAPQDFSGQQCQRPIVRKEWFSLTEQERQAWQKAFLEIAKSGNQRSYYVQGGSMLDDLAYVHLEMFEEIHFTALFLPAHTVFMRGFYQMMKMVGYTGPEIYVDVTRLVAKDDFRNAPLWTPQHLGGDGHGGAIPDGPFANLEGRVFPNQNGEASYLVHKITRNFNDDPNGKTQRDRSMWGGWFNERVVRRIMNINNFEEMRNTLEGTFHQAHHVGVGGEMFVKTSPYDPWFYFIHGNVEHLWRSWQQVWDPSYTQFGGPKLQVAFNETKNYHGPTMNLDDTIEMLNLFQQVKVRDVINPKAGINCFTYDHYYRHY